LRNKERISSEIGATRWRKKWKHFFVLGGEYSGGTDLILKRLEVCTTDGFDLKNYKNQALLPFH
jgi:hypothetical protein